MKSTAVERLLESWLDSQTERRYQPAFIQLLVSEGWTVLHNTRHSPIELGKDVIARDPGGKLFCFQLKGNPGSRVTKTEAQGLLPQVVELLELPAPRSFRKSDEERHIAVFVTNGEIDEEARLVFDGASERAGKPGVAAEAFEIWTRGPLLKKLVERAGAVWPSSIEGTQRMLELMSADGRETPRPSTLAEAFAAAVPSPQTTSSAASKNSALSSLFLLTEILKSAWYRTNNHYALYLITVIGSAYGLQFADVGPRRKSVTRYAALALEHCADLLSEAQLRGFEPDQVWAEHEVLSEFDVLWERRRLVADCAATLVLAGDYSPFFDKDYASILFHSTCSSPRMWGLAALPALISRTWARHRLDPSQVVEGHLAAHLGRLIAINLERVPGTPPLACPYYSFEDVWAHTMDMPYFTDNSIGRDNFRRRAWGIRAVLYMLAKRNLKQTCRSLWPGFSRLLHEEPELPPHTFFTPALATEGRMVTIAYHHMTWNGLVQEAVELGNVPFLEPHKDLAWLLASYVVVVPFRASSAVLLWLDAALNQTWYHSGHLPPPSQGSNG